MMSESDPAVPRFQMVGARAAVLGGPIAEPIEDLIDTIENALAGVPDFAFDLAKTLVEAVCQTVFADKGESADKNWNCPKLVRETLNRLTFLPKSLPSPAKPRESVTKIIHGLAQTVHGLCELRNNYGMASHGRDAFSARLDLRQATLAAQAADTIVSFVYRIHRDALAGTPGDRVHYEDHKEFNEAFDSDRELVELCGLELLPSRVLYDADKEAYKAELLDYLETRAHGSSAGADEEPAEATS